MIGVDVKIEELRKVFEDYLWTTTSYISYGRAFVIKRMGEKTPNIYLENNLDYQDVLINDRVDAGSFFIVRPDRPPLGNSFSDYNAEVDIYFSVKLDKTYTAVTERAVEYVHRDVINLISGSDFKNPKIVTGDKAFSDFGFVKIGDNMQPFYLVKFETSVDYKLNENC